jgi:hypothetical protein
MCEQGQYIPLANSATAITVQQAVQPPHSLSVSDDLYINRLRRLGFFQRFLLLVIGPFSSSLEDRPCDRWGSEDDLQ